jgi:hypothetical protein
MEHFQSLMMIVAMYCILGSRDFPDGDIPQYIQAIMLLRLTLAILALLSRVLSENISDPQCLFKDQHYPVMKFRVISCFLCYKFMHNSSFKPNTKTTNMTLFADNATVSYLST